MLLWPCQVSFQSIDVNFDFGILASEPPPPSGLGMIEKTGPDRVKLIHDNCVESEQYFALLKNTNTGPALWPVSHDKALVRSKTPKFLDAGGTL